MKLIFASLLVFILTTSVALAGDCFQDPIYERDQNGEVVISAYVRDVACMEGSKILTTVVKGSVIKIIGQTDGWYKVRLSDGMVGWVGQTLMQVTSKPLTNSGSTTTITSGSGLPGLKGYIFLAVEKNGEAFYYNPVDSKAYFLGRPADAFDIMREHGLGATHDYIQSTTYFPAKLYGRILLDVEANGEAYYIYPKDGKKYYLGRPTDAFDIMRNLGLGISNTNLLKLNIVY